MPPRLLSSEPRGRGQVPRRLHEGKSRSLELPIPGPGTSSVETGTWVRKTVEGREVCVPSFAEGLSYWLTALWALMALLKARKREAAKLQLPESLQSSSNLTRAARSPKKGARP